MKGFTFKQGATEYSIPESQEEGGNFGIIQAMDIDSPGSNSDVFYFVTGESSWADNIQDLYIYIFFCRWIFHGYSRNHSNLRGGVSEKKSGKRMILITDKLKSVDVVSFLTKDYENGDRLLQVVISALNSNQSPIVS